MRHPFGEGNTVQSRLWEITERNFQPDSQNHYETLFTVGNGYLGTRGALEEGFEGDLPSTLVHGIYDHAPNTLVPELVNVPNWLPIHISIDGTPFKIVTKSDDIHYPSEGLVLGYRRWLDVYHAVLHREVLFRAASGSIVRLAFERFASLSDEHVLAQRVTITAVEGTPKIEVESALEGNVKNGKVAHWQPNMNVVAEGSAIGLEAVT